MDYKDYIKAGDLKSALADIKVEIKNFPSKVELRIFYFQLLCVLGNWDKAILQLDIMSKLSKENVLFSKIFSEIIDAEKEREKVLSGVKKPTILGKPEQWVAKIIKANEYINQNKYQYAMAILDEAYAESPAIAGEINGESFEWISDSDSRFGPLMEIIIGDVYYWMPFQRIEMLSIEKPKDLRDLVWAPISLKLSNGTEMAALLPVRYPNTEKSSDSMLKLSRKTDWNTPFDNLYLGTGQRTLMTDKAEYSILDIRNIKFKV